MTVDKVKRLERELEKLKKSIEKVNLEEEGEDIDEWDQEVNDNPQKVNGMLNVERILNAKNKSSLERKENEDGSITIDGENYPEIIKKGDIEYIREDKTLEFVEEMPKEVKKMFLEKEKKSKWWNPLSWFYKGKPELFYPRGNLALILDNEGNILIRDNVKPGYLEVIENEGTTKEKKRFPILKPGKLRTIMFEEDKVKDNKAKMNYWKAWVVDVNNAVALPEDPLYEAEPVSDIIIKATTGNLAFNTKEKKGIGGWVKWIFIAIAVGYIGYIAVTRNLYGLGDLVGYGKSAGAIAGSSSVPVNVPGGTISG